RLPQVIDAAHRGCRCSSPRRYRVTIAEIKKCKTRQCYRETMDEYVAAGSGNPEIEAGIQAFVARYSFPVDDFQIEAIHHLAEGRSVLVAAPTGTGKTLVAEYAIWQAQQRNQRVIYTTPLK